MNHHVLVTFDNRLQIDNLIPHAIQTLLLECGSFIGVLDIGKFFID